MRPSRARSPSRLAACLLLGVASASIRAQNVSEAAPADIESILHDERAFAIDAMPLDAAALRFSDEAGVQLLMNPLTDTKMQSNPVRGRMPIDRALDMLLAGTPLRWRALGRHTVTIERVDSFDPATQHVLEPIRVEGIRKKLRADFRATAWDDRVVATLDRYKRYPPSAQRLGLQDVVYVRITVDRSGRILDSVVARSRGMPVLDAAALELVTRVGRLPRLPDEIEGSPYRIVVPIDYFIARQ